MNSSMQNQADKDQQKSGNQDQKPGQQQGGQNQTRVSRPRSRDRAASRAAKQRKARPAEFHSEVIAG